MSDKAFTELSKKVAAYIESTQPILDAYSDLDAKFMRKAAEAAGVLSGRGIISQAETAVLIDKLAEDKTRALDLVMRLAGMIGADELGKSAEDIKIRKKVVDPFDALVLYGDPERTEVLTAHDVD